MFPANPGPNGASNLTVKYFDDALPRGLRRFLLFFLLLDTITISFTSFEQELLCVVTVFQLSQILKDSTTTKLATGSVPQGLAYFPIPLHISLVRVNETRLCASLLAQHSHCFLTRPISCELKTP
jgi:hypothetical protein